MGPRSVERGNAVIRLMGATGLFASMGPRSVERGNFGCRGLTRRTLLLQWGRVLLNAESDSGRSERAT